MATKVAICNQALAHLGSSSTISNIDTEASQEARTMRLFWEDAKNATLRDFSWPFSTKFKALELIEESPTSEWGYAYKYPNDCLDIRRILSGLRNDNRQSRVSYIISQTDQGMAIFTDQQNAEIEYTAKCDNPGIFPSDFSLALSLRLAAYTAPQITKGDQYKLGVRSLELYAMHVNRAIATGKNEEQRDESPESELFRSRS